MFYYFYLVYSVSAYSTASLRELLSANAFLSFLVFSRARELASQARSSITIVSDIVIRVMSPQSFLHVSTALRKDAFNM